MRLGLPHLPALWNNTVAKLPHNVAFVHEGQSVTYGQADELVGRLAGYLAAVAEVRAGDRVCLALPNCPEFLLAYWATLRLGAVVAPINSRLRADELAYVLQNCEPRAVVLHDQTAKEMMSALAATKLNPHVLAVGTETLGEPWPRALNYPAGQAEGQVEAADLAIILHTSGTTGVPKGAMMRHRDLIINVTNAILAHSFRAEDVNLLAIPCFAPTATYSLLPTCAYLGSQLVIAPRPHPRELLALLADHHCTTFIGVPTMFHLVVSEAGFAEHPPFDALRLVAYSGSPMPTHTIRRLQERFPRAALHNFFGLTETISITHVLPGPDALPRADSIGKLLPEVYARLVDEKGCEVAVGEVGELCLHRDNVIPGYWNRPGLLEESLREGWFYTGDLARVDHEGYYYVQGRKKEMIIVAGQNVYAHEVEKVILRHEGVKEVAVVGIPATGARAALGELVKAVVVCQSNCQLAERDIKRHCSQLLPSYKVPQVVEFRAELPRNPGGKIIKRDLVDRVSAK